MATAASGSSCSLAALGEMEQIICQLERGTLIQKFYPRKRPEKKTLMLRRETRQVCLTRRVSVSTIWCLINLLGFDFFFFSS